MSQEEYKRRLKALMNKPENQVCSDCPERQPRWASLIVPPPGAPPGSLPIGAFCCLECSGSHRRLGVHISFVRSINLDSWKEKEVLAMENGGNAKVNAIFEARLEHFGTHAGKPRTGADGRTRERYIRDKYERRKYYDASAFSTFQEESEEDSDESEEDEPKRKNKNAGGKIAPLRAPSDAAKKRAESRRTRLAAARGSSGATKNTKTKSKKAAPKAPPPAPAPEVDLLDFGDFTSATPESEPPAQQLAPPPSDEPVLDLFATMTVTTTTANDKAEDKTSFFAGAPPPAVAPPSPPGESDPQAEPKKVLNNDEILSMFNTGQAPNQMGYGYGGGVNNNMMAMNNGGMNFNNGMVPNAMMPQNMGNVPQNMTHMMQVQQQQRNMMMMGQVPPGMNMMMQMQQQTTDQQQKTRMMMMMQQQQQRQQQQYNMGNVNMNQQHIAMMNQLQMGNSMMMMATAPGNGDKSKNQEFGLFQQGQTPQQNQAAGMNGFGF